MKLIKCVEEKDPKAELPYEDMAHHSDLAKKFPLAPSTRKRGEDASLNLLLDRKRIEKA